MVLSAVVAILVSGSQGGKAAQATEPVSLKRVFHKGMKSNYNVDANLQSESRQRGLETLIPEELEITYKFSTTVKDVISGIASVRYTRPTMTQLTGETVDKDPVPEVDKVNQILDLSISPINELLDIKDLTPKPKKPKSSDGISKVAGLTKRQESLGDFVGPFISDLYRLALYINGEDASLDFSPKFDLQPVKVGDSWKRTVSYQPQKLKGKTDKTIVQRLDLTYTYKGLMSSHGKSIQRVHAELHLNTDLGNYLNDLFDAKPEVTGVKSIPTVMDLHMDFDLDPVSFQTIYAQENSTGSVKIFSTLYPDPVEEINIKGNTVMRLVSNVMVPPKAAAKPSKAK